MKIAISGAKNTGKLKLIKEILTNWPMYRALTSYNYPSQMVDKNAPVPVLEKMETFAKEVDNMGGQNHILFLGSPLDILIEGLVQYGKGEIDDQIMSDLTFNCHETLRKLDCVFVLSKYFDDEITWHSIEEQADSEYRTQIMSSLMYQYYNHIEDDIIFPAGDCPGIIEFEDNNYIAEIRGVLNKAGNLYDEEDEQKFQAEMMNSLAASKKNLRPQMENLIAANQQLVDPKFSLKIPD